VYEGFYLQKVTNLMENLKLIKPTIDYKEQVLQIVQEFYDDNTTFY
jgi:predicted acetyltransferase